MSSMSVNIDGLRMNLSREVLELRNIVENVLNGENYDKDSLKECMDSVIQSSNVFNCVYNDEIDNFNNINHIHVDLTEY